MKRLTLSITMALCVLLSHSQTTQIGYFVASVTALKSYTGNANKITITATGQEFFLCPTCTADEVTVFAGPGGRKWKKITITSQDITDFNNAVTASPAVAAKASVAQLTAERTAAAELLNKTIDFGAGKGNVAKNLKISNFDTGQVEIFDPSSVQSSSFNLQNQLKAIGSPFKNVAIGLPYYPIGTSVYGSNSLYGSGEVSFSAMYFNKGDTVKGVDYLILTTGNYTAQGFNGLLFFAVNGASLTLVAQTANTANIWKGATNTFTNLNFTTAYVVPTTGVYYAGAMYNSTTPGADVVSPQIAHLSTGFYPKLNFGFTGGKFMYGKGWYNLQPPSSILISNIQPSNANDPAYVWSH